MSTVAPVPRDARAPARAHGEGPLSTAAWTLIFLLAVAVVVVVGGAGVEIQSYFVMAALVGFVAMFVIPRASANEPTVSRRMLAAVVVVFLLGSLIRYLVIEIAYGGISDSWGYYGAGLTLAEQFRALDFSGLVPPFSDTNAMNYYAGFLYLVLPPAQLAGFVVSAAMAVIGAWHFYRAFCIAYPEGNRRLYALLIFFLPSFWYWNTSFGKDAPVFMALGLATYGFALLFRKLSARAIAFIVAGLAIAAIMRAPIAAALGLAGVGAYALRPVRARSVNVQALSYIAFLPLLIAGAFILISAAREQVAIEGFDVPGAFQARQEQLADDANFTAPNPFTPTGLPIAVITAGFRPFPFEAGSAFQALQSLESVLLLGLFLVKMRETWRGVVGWRRNAMTVLALTAVLILSVELASLSNFGLLARQRTQLLPFLLMLPAMMSLPRRRAVESA